MRHKSFFLKMSLPLLAVFSAVVSIAAAQTVVPTRHHHSSSGQATSVVLLPTAATASTANSQIVQALASARTLLATANRDYEGHRASAAQEVRKAMAALGYRRQKTQAASTVNAGAVANPGAAAGQGAIRKTQANSDAQLGQARQILQGVLSQTNVSRPKASAHLTAAILHINTALSLK
jgi:hypothetical protein